MRKEEFYFDSRDGQSKIFAVRYTPDGDNVTGVLQIIHGMAEHIERYEEFAQYMTDNGYVVTGECHLGHGKSVGEDGQRGFFCSNDPATVPDQSWPPKALPLHPGTKGSRHSADL